MDDKTAQLLTAFAAKLGTTTEYLWGVLLKQAPITGTVDLLIYAAVIVGTLYYVKLIRFVHSKVTAIEYAERWDEITWAPVAILGVAVIFFWIAMVCSLSSTVAAFLNPEYWALQQVLSKVK